MAINLSEQRNMINTWVAELRDTQIQQDPLRFRENLARIGMAMALEISKELPYEARDVQTPLGVSRETVLAEQPVLATILRAGLPMHEGMSRVFDRADNAFLAEYRRHDKHGNFVDVESGYITSPDTEGRIVILCDPMLATASSILRAYRMIDRVGTPKEFYVAAVIAAQAGVNRLERELPQAKVWCAAIDPELNDKKYIVPGLGDAGDLAYGQKMQN